MKLQFLVIILLLLCITTFAGERDSININDPRFIIKTPVLSYIDFVGGLSYRIGVEIKIHRNISTSLEAGKYFCYDNDHRKGEIIRTELKYYGNDHECTGNYFSVEYLYKNVTFNFVDSFAIPAQPRYEKEYKLHKEISCLTFKYGELSSFYKRFIFEWYVGAGLRFYSSAYNDLSADENRYVLTGEGHGDIIGNAIRYVGRHLIPNLNAGIKIGYIIR
jgi:hypothetical protein